MTVGERIKYIRLQLQMNQTDFARKLGLKTPVSISNYENGTREPDFATIIKIAELGNSTLDWLLNEIGDPPFIKPESNNKKSVSRSLKQNSYENKLFRDAVTEDKKPLVLTQDELEIIQKMRMIPGSQKLLNQILEGRLKIQEAFCNFAKISIDNKPDSSGEITENQNTD